MVAIVALGTLVTIGALILNHERAERTAQAWAVDAVESISRSLSSGFQRAQGMARGLSGFVGGSEEVERDEFDFYAERLVTEDPEIVSVQVLEYIPGEQREAFEARLAELGVTGMVEYDGAGGVVKAPERDDYLAVWLDFPTFGHNGLSGTNFLTQPGDERTIEEMVSSGDTGVPPSDRIAGPGGGEFGLVVMEPIFEPGVDRTDPAERSEAFTGVASVVIAYSGLADADPTQTMGKVDLVVVDPQVPSSEFVMGWFGGEPSHIAGGPRGGSDLSRFSYTEEVELGPRSLLVAAVPTAEAEAALVAGSQPWIVAGGVLVTLLAIVVYLWWSRVRRLERFARALEETNEELEETNDELERVFGRDLLTDLPNRLSLQLEVDAAMSHDDGRDVSVVLLDLDRFKDLNDGMGHKRGDELLGMVARRLDANVHHGTLGRMGGDEFGVILSGGDPATAVAVAERLVSCLRRPFLVGERSVSLTATAGVCSMRSGAAEAEELWERAGMAMHTAKARHRDLWMVFDDEMARASDRRTGIESELRRALEGVGAPVLTHFQPEIDLLTGRVVSAEALARWTHPEMGVVSPAEFIDVAEESGLIVAIGEQQMGRAIDLLSRCRATGVELRSVSVNVSAQQFRHSGLLGFLERTLGAAGVPPGSLVLEITESQAMDHAEYGVLQERMDDLRELGVELSIDDFGTGHSSLSRVEGLPVQELKVDQSFVAGLPGRRSAVGITRAIISMAHTLGLRVVAEGVETAEQRDWLLAERCDLVQGWFYSRAMNASSFMDLLRAQDAVGPPVVEPAVLDGSPEPGSTDMVR